MNIGFDGIDRFDDDFFIDNKGCLYSYNNTDFTSTIEIDKDSINLSCPNPIPSFETRDGKLIIESRGEVYEVPLERANFNELVKRVEKLENKCYNEHSSLIYGLGMDVKTLKNRVNTIGATLDKHLIEKDIEKKSEKCYGSLRDRLNVCFTLNEMKKN